MCFRGTFTQSLFSQPLYEHVTKGWPTPCLLTLFSDWSRIWALPVMANIDLWRDFIRGYWETVHLSPWWIMSCEIPSLLPLEERAVCRRRHEWNLGPYCVVPWNHLSWVSQLLTTINYLCCVKMYELCLSVLQQKIIWSLHHMSQ